MKKLTLTICAVMLIIASTYASVAPVKGAVSDQKATVGKKIVKQACPGEQKLRASISFTDACGNQLTVTGTCESCTNISEWNTAFNSWWSQNSTGGCINQEWLEQ